MYRKYKRKSYKKFRRTYGKKSLRKKVFRKNPIVKKVLSMAETKYVTF